MNSEPTIFEKIIKGEIPCHKIYEDENTLAFLDAFPDNIGHTLVVPKNHSKNVLDISDEDWTKVVLTAKKVAKAVKTALNADGIFLAMNNDEGQEVFHSHVHVIPRFKGDNWTIGRKLEYKDGEAEATAEKIAKEIN